MGANLGTHLKIIKYGMDNICAKFGEFARIWTKRSFFSPGAPDYVSQAHINLLDPLFSKNSSTSWNAEGARWST